MVTHGIKGSVPKEQYDRFILVYHGEKELKQAAGFDRPDDAYLLVIDRTGAVHWSFHGPVTDAAVEQIGQHLNH
jgi:predicted transcriptional regulator